MAMAYEHGLQPVQKEEHKGLPDRAANELLRFIRKNNLKVGDRLPAQIMLASQLNVSLPALREALASLQASGLIKQVHGIGTFLASDPYIVKTLIDSNLSTTEMIREAGLEPGTSDTAISMEIPPLDFSSALKLKPHQKVRCLRRVRTADGIPIAYSIAFFSDFLGHIDLGGLPAGGSLYRYLEQSYSIYIQRSDVTIEVATAFELTSVKLGIPVNTPLLKLAQVHYDIQGRIIITSIELFVQNQIKLKITRERPTVR
jgi:GntR family transcriptional regulator